MLPRYRQKNQVGGQVLDGGGVTVNGAGSGKVGIFHKPAHSWKRSSCFISHSDFFFYKLYSHLSKFHLSLGLVKWPKIKILFTSNLIYDLNRYLFSSLSHMVCCFKLDVTKTEPVPYNWGNVLFCSPLLSWLASWPYSKHWKPKTSEC